jgi:hypothetical protein
MKKEWSDGVFILVLAASVLVMLFAMILGGHSIGKIYSAWNGGKGVEIEETK